MKNRMEIVMGNRGLLSLILTPLSEPQDRYSASLVCRAWNDAIEWAVHKLSVRSTALLPSLLPRFKHVNHLQLDQCCDQLQDSDLQVISESLKSLLILSLGSPEQPQVCISDQGLVGFVKNYTMLQEITLSSIPNLADSGMETIARICKRLRSIHLQDCRNLSDVALNSLRNCKNIQELSLTGFFGFSASGLSKIGKNCPKLLKFSLDFGDYVPGTHSIDITSALRSLATHCLHLQILSLKFLKGNLRELSGLSTLIALSIHTYGDQQACPDYSLATIVAANTNLKEFVYFNWSSPLNDAALLMIIQNCRKLEKLCLVAKLLTESSLLHITDCNALTSLALDGFHSDGKCLALLNFSGMELKEFSLRSASLVTDAELETLLLSNSKLERINLNGCLVQTSKGFSAIGLCSNLQILDLSFTAVDDLSLATIASGAKMIRHLSLVWCTNISNLKILTNFRALEYLDVTNCNFVTDEGLGFLATSCSKLFHLTLVSTRITDDGLANLACCSMLRSLEIYYCAGIQGPGLGIIALSCKWIRSMVISNRFEGTAIVDELRKQCCVVRLLDDDEPI